MKTRKIVSMLLSTVIILLAFTCMVFAEDVNTKKKIAFVGDSITFGAGLNNRENEAFVSLIKFEYGDDYEIGNFGKSATSALKTAKYPYVDTDEYKNSVEFNPDILVIMFGTNDIKNENWDEWSGNFIGDYVALINSYKIAKPNVKVYVGIPPRIFKENVIGQRSPAILENEGIPAIYKVIEEVGATPIDYFAPTKDMPELFPDFLHPNSEGHRIFAKIASDVLFENKGILFGASDWAKEELERSYAAGIMPKPLADDYHKDITRQEFCEMVVNIIPKGLTASRTAAFEDCQSEAVNYAYSVGVINGMSDTIFAPDQGATREEMAAMLYRAFKLISPEVKISVSGTYPDADSISEWAKESVDFLNENKIMNGDELGRINPRDNTSCEEAILLVYRTHCVAYSYSKVE